MRERIFFTAMHMRLGFAQLWLMAALCSPPLHAQTLLNPAELIDPTDYPIISLLKGEEGVVDFKLTVGRNGNAESCKVLETSGYIDLDQKTCELIKFRAKFDVSQVPQGTPIPAYRNRVRWVLPVTEPRQPVAGLSVEESLSKTDRYKKKCVYSDGNVRFVRSSISCFQDIVNAGAVKSVAAGSAPSKDDADFSNNIALARAGNIESFMLVAIQYMNGVGTTKDPQKAIFWARRAEKEAVPDAYYYLAMWHYSGSGVEQDIQKSYDYLKLAMSSGYSKPWVPYFQETLKRHVGANGYACMEYGFRFKTSDYAMCNLQIEQSNQQREYAQQQAEIARQQIELERLQLQQQQLAASAGQRLAEQERQARERRERSEALMKLSEDMLCPKKSPGIFAEPVAGCGRNKNQPVPPTVNVIIRRY